jgi:hypothetical protein
MADTRCQWILSATRAMNTTVNTPVTIVIQVCSRMIRSKPITPPKMVSPTTKISAITLVPSPPPTPTRWNTVAVASVAKITSTVSQPTVSSQEITVGSLLPLTPNAARLKIIVGAEPRLPATAMNPQARNDNTIPTMPTISACQNEMPKPSSNEP